MQLKMSVVVVSISSAGQNEDPILVRTRGGAAATCCSSWGESKLQASRNEQFLPEYWEENIKFLVDVV